MQSTRPERPFNSCPVCELQNLESPPPANADLERVLGTNQQVVASIRQDAIAVIHPMRSLPNEILLNIFHSFLLLSEDEENALEGFPANTLAGVCRRWYELAKETSSLWNNITIYTLEDPPYDSEAFANVNVYVKRSKLLPLTIDIMGNPIDDMHSEGNKQLARVAKVLRPSTSRWRTAKLLDVLTSLPANLSNATFDSLTHLTMTFHDSFDPLPPTFTWITPRLIELSLWEPFPVMELTWHVLRKFTAGYRSFAHLPHCRDLEVLEILEPSLPQQDEVTGPITLPRLGALCLTQHTPHFPATLSDRLIVPNLHSLRLIFRVVDANVANAFFYPNLQGVIPQLRWLAVHSTRPAHPTFAAPFLQFLSQCTSLETLELDAVFACTNVLTALSQVGNPPLLPRLTTLSVPPSAFLDNGANLRNIIYSRTSSQNNTVQNLQRLNMLHIGTDYEEVDTSAEAFIQRSDEEAMAREEITSGPWRNAGDRVVITEVYSESLTLED